MVDISSPFGSEDDGHFDDPDAFVPDHVPAPGPFLVDQSVLTDDDHVEVHEVARDVFEERGVYDMTFGYNLARLNADARHPDAGYRYAEANDSNTLRAEFTPTTPFCPQSHTLAIGSFRAWNGLSDRHEYDVVRVRVHPMHNESERINRRLTAAEEAYRETGSVSETSTESGLGTSTPGAGRAGGDASSREADFGHESPF
jgi:hypothetical protein